MASPDAFSQIEQWVSKCEDAHPGCPKDNKGSRLPRRVIDVGPPDGSIEPYLYSKSPGERGSYIALSYCWGGPQPLTTTVLTLEALSECIPLAKLPKTLADAVFVTRRLGLRYLWIDALCIIQDSDQDKAEQIQSMADIYQQAYLTISAAGAVRCQDGFLKTRHLSDFRGTITMPYVCRDGRPGTIYLRSMTGWHDDDHVISSRAWTLQERLLSPRTIFYGRRLSWQCQKALQFFPDLPGDSIENSFKFGGQIRLRNNIFKTPTVSAWWTSLIRDWHVMLKEYMHREMSDPHDKLSAVAGVASQFQRLTGDAYLAGLWKRDLVLHLAWRAAPDVGWYHGREPTLRSPVARAPSWSWASIDGFIQWDNSTPTLGRQLCDILDVRVRPHNASAPLGRVASGHLTIRAHCKELLLSTLDAPAQCVAERASFPDAVAALQTYAANHPGSSWENKSRLVAWLGCDRVTFCMLDCPGELSSGHGDDYSGPPYRVVTCVPLQAEAGETKGLVLRQLKDGLYQRIGFFFNFFDDWSTPGSEQITVTII